jgi:hypothetical protein
LTWHSTFVLMVNSLSMDKGLHSLKTTFVIGATCSVGSLPSSSLAGVFVALSEVFPKYTVF